MNEQRRLANIATLMTIEEVAIVSQYIPGFGVKLATALMREPVDHTERDRPLYDHEEEVVATLEQIGWSVYPPGYTDPLYTADDLADMYGTTAAVVYQRAKRLGVGERLGQKHLIFRQSDIERLRPSTPGRPRKQPEVTDETGT